MDGTLLDSSYAMTNSVNHVRKSFGLPPIQKEYLEYHINRPQSDLSMKLYETKEYLPIQKERFAEHYLVHADQYIEPYDGVYELLRVLHAEGIILNIATNAPDIFAQNMLKGQEMLDFFSFVVGANSVENSKPSPDMLHHISKLSSIPLSETIFIGDSAKDEEAAKNADTEFLFATWGYGKSINKSKRFENVNELQKYLLLNI